MLEILAAIAGAVVLVAIVAVVLGLRAKRKRKAPTTDQLYPLW